MAQMVTPLRQERGENTHSRISWILVYESDNHSYPASYSSIAVDISATNHIIEKASTSSPQPVGPLVLGWRDIYRISTILGRV